MSNPYISFTLDLERSLSEGNYNKVLNSFGNFPLESYKGFINKMIETVRYDGYLSFSLLVMILMNAFLPLTTLWTSTHSKSSFISIIILPLVDFVLGLYAWP